MISLPMTNTTEHKLFKTIYIIRRLVYMVYWGEAVIDITTTKSELPRPSYALVA